MRNYQMTSHLDPVEHKGSPALQSVQMETGVRGFGNHAAPTCRQPPTTERQRCMDFTSPNQGKESTTWSCPRSQVCLIFHHSTASNSILGKTQGTGPLEVAAAKHSMSEKKNSINTNHRQKMFHNQPSPQTYMLFIGAFCFCWWISHHTDRTQMHLCRYWRRA